MWRAVVPLVLKYCLFEWVCVVCTAARRSFLVPAPAWATGPRLSLHPPLWVLANSSLPLSAYLPPSLLSAGGSPGFVLVGFWVYFIVVTAHFGRLPFLCFGRLGNRLAVADRFSYRPMLADFLQPLCIGWWPLRLLWVASYAFLLLFAPVLFLLRSLLLLPGKQRFIFSISCSAQKLQ